MLYINVCKQKPHGMVNLNLPVFVTIFGYIIVKTNGHNVTQRAQNLFIEVVIITSNTAVIQRYSY